MNHKQRPTLHALFAHPVSSNIEPRLAYSLVETLGGEVTHGGHGHLVAKLNGHTHGFHDPTTPCRRTRSPSLRKFLEAAGIDPVRDFPLGTGRGIRAGFRPGRTADKPGATARTCRRLPAGSHRRPSRRSAAHAIAAMRHDPAAIRRLFESGEYPYKIAMRTAPYEAHMLELQRELLKAQRWIEQTGQRIVVLFEGRDAAGKGGTIKRFTEHMNPRTARVIALQKPTEREQTQWYFQRYITHLPAAGEIVLFDRSWYNRAGVERVMGFCTPNDYLEFMRQCPEFERMLVRSGIGCSSTGSRSAVRSSAAASRRARPIR